MVAATSPARPAYNPHMHRILPLAMLIALGSGLAACGLKGDLYLPEPAPEAAPAADASPPAQAPGASDGDTAAD